MVFFITVASSGCGEGGDGANNGGEPVDASAVVEELAAAQCAKIFECCAADELQDVFGALEVEDEPACREALRTRAEAFFRPALEQSLQNRRASLQQEAVDGCAAAIRERSCADFEPTPSVEVLSTPGCGDVVSAELSLSAFCTEDYECETGFCSRPAGEAEGSCKNAPQSEDACLNDRCATGLYCASEEVCAEKLGAGEVCTRNTDCESDSCQPGEDGEFVCAELPDICSG